MIMETQYYGFAHKFGLFFGDDFGDLLGEMHIFATADARDAWVGKDIYGGVGPRGRTALTQEHRADRRAILRLSQWPKIIYHHPKWALPTYQMTGVGYMVDMDPDRPLKRTHYFGSATEASRAFEGACGRGIEWGGMDSCEIARVLGTYNRREYF